MICFLQVVSDLISSRLITDRLQESALEQLSVISADLCVLINNAKLLKENVPLLTSVLNVITSTMRLSMKRKIYQSHFTLSLHGVFYLCQATVGSTRSAEHKLTMELGIDAILMNGPMPILSEMVLYSCTAFNSLATKSTFLALLICFDYLKL
jgi:nucleolar pre-ribosomal-associated protein 1